MGRKRILEVPLKKCHNCGREVRGSEFEPEYRCIRCGYHLRACTNCVFYDGIMCMMQNPDGFGLYAGNHCREFDFRTEKPIHVKMESEVPARR